MKQINYSGSSKLIRRIVYLLNRKAPLPLNGDGDPDWGTDGQVLTTDGAGGTRWGTGGGSSDVVDVKVNGTSVVDGNKVANVTVPTRVSDLTNDTGFITNTVNNLTNYYLSSNTYTKTEVDSLISAIMTLNILVVQSLPVSDISTTTIYLVPKSTPDTQDVYDEYINLDGTSSGWEHIGSTQIDLSNYYTKTEINALLSAKANTADLATVATSGSYTDLSNTPTIPAAQIQSDWNQSDSSAVDYIKNKPTITPFDIDTATPTFTEASTRANIASGETVSTLFGKIKKFFTDLKTVAFTGSYNDLTDKPSVPGGENYVLKAGDTMSGYLTIEPNNDVPLRIKRLSGNSSSKTYMLFSNVSGGMGFYAVGPDKRPWFEPFGGSDIRIPLEDEVISIHEASSSSVGSVIVTHAALTGRTQLFAYGNGNNIPWLIEIVVGSDYVSCVVLCGTASRVGVKYIDATHFAITSGTWDRVIVCGRVDFSVATASASQGIDGTYTKYPLASGFLDSLNGAARYIRYSGSGVTPTAWACMFDTNGNIVPCAASTGADASTVAVRNSNGYLYAVFYNASNSAENINSYDLAYVVFKDKNGWMRCASLASFKTWFGMANSANTANTARSASYATVAGYIGSGTDYKCTMEVQATSLPCKLVLQSDYNLVLYKNGSAVWNTNTSSRRFKHNIQSMTEERAKKILQIRAVTFDWNDGQPVTTQKCDNVGVIAEEVSQIIPDVVVFEQYDNDPNTRIERRVEYERFTPYLIKMVQMQQKQIDTMQATINALEQRLSKLEGK